MVERSVVTGSGEQPGDVVDAMPAWQWWAAVLTGLAAPVLATPVGDPVPSVWRVGLLLALPFVAVVTGFTPTFRRLLRGLRGRDGRGRDGRGRDQHTGGALILTLAMIVGLVGGAWALLQWGISSLVSATGLAVSVHLVAGRVSRSLLSALPGGDPDPPPPADRRGPRHWADWGARGWVPLAVGAATASVVLVLANVGTAPEGLSRALAVLLVASPAAFHIARDLPGRAARDRGRDLGVGYDGVDLRQVAGVASVVLTPQAVCDPQPRLARIHPAGRLQVTAALQAAASVAAGSEAPAHRAITRAARERGLVLRPTTAAPGTSPSSVSPADGVPPARSAAIKGTVVTLGRAEDVGDVPDEIAGHQMYVGWGGIARAGFDLVPLVRSQALADRSDLDALGLRPILVGHVPADLRHVGEALEIPPRHRRDLGEETLADVLAQEAADGVVLVLDSPLTDSLGLGAQVSQVLARRRGANDPTADDPNAGDSNADGPTADGPTADGPTADDSKADRPQPVSHAVPVVAHRCVLVVRSGLSGADRVGGATPDDPSASAGHDDSSATPPLSASASRKHGAGDETSDPASRPPGLSPAAPLAPAGGMREGGPAEGLRTANGDLSGALRAVGLARKASRVSMQSVLLAAVVGILGFLGAVADLVRPEVAALVGAALPVLVTINSLRPRSYARGADPATT